MSDAAWRAQIEKARKFRVRPGKDVSIVGAVEAARAETARRARAVGGVGAAWAEALPREWGSKTEVIGVSRGLLTVRVTDSAARYAIDRWLRGGGEERVISLAPAGVRRVRLVV